MNKKMIKGLILLGIGLALGIVGLVFWGKAGGTSLLYASSKMGLYYIGWPVLLLLAALLGWSGFKGARKNYVKKENPVKVKAPKPAPAAASVAYTPAAPVTPTQVSFQFCAMCGTRNDGEDKFCAKCGQPL